MLYDLPDYPVIVEHLEDPQGSGLAACCGKFIPLIPERYHDVPRMICVGCVSIAKGRTTAVVVIEIDD